MSNRYQSYNWYRVECVIYTIRQHCCLFCFTLGIGPVTLFCSSWEAFNRGRASPMRIELHHNNVLLLLLRALTVDFVVFAAFHLNLHSYGEYKQLLAKR